VDQIGQLAQLSRPVDRALIGSPARTTADVFIEELFQKHHGEIYAYLDERREILRPANFLRSQPGHGWCVVTRDDVRLGVVSLSGEVLDFKTSANASWTAWQVPGVKSVKNDLTVKEKA